MSDGLELFVCPVCGGELRRSGGCLSCDKGHSFDIAAQGYVNLMLTSRSGSGDNAMMVASRRRFLEHGYYGIFKDAISALAAGIYKRKNSGSVVFIDAGCGEGYYTEGVCEALRACGAEVKAAGIDISKPAVKSAAKRCCGAGFCVGSAFKMPLKAECGDIVLSVFAPLSEGEFLRVLRRGGSLIIAAPGPRHLFGLKEAIYDKPYENEPNRFDFPGFEHVGVKTVGGNICIERREDISSLFEMTPYYWKTSAEGSRRLKELNRLRTEIQFELHELRKL